jgi:uncharacterized DUF497 family protein
MAQCLSAVQISQLNPAKTLLSGHTNSNSRNCWNSVLILVDPKNRNQNYYTSQISGSLLKHVERYMKVEKGIRIIILCHTSRVITSQLSRLPVCHFPFIYEVRPKKQLRIVSFTYALRSKRQWSIVSVIYEVRPTKQLNIVSLRYPLRRKKYRNVVSVIYAVRPKKQ